MYQLGDIVFEGLRGFDTLKKQRETVYAEIPLMLGKPRLQRTGTALQNISIGIILHASFTDPAADIATLDGYREAGNILPLITGEGEVVGNFIIVTIDETVVQTSPTGRTLTAELSLSLREHYDPNKPATAAAAAVAGAFAVGSSKVIPVQLVRTQPLPFAVASQSATAGNSACLSSIATIQQAQSNPEQQVSLFQRAKNSLDNATKAYNTLIDTVQTHQNVAAKGPALFATANTILGNVAAVRASLVAGDLTNALTNSDALTASLGSMDDAIRPINAVLITRRPQ